MFSSHLSLGEECPKLTPEQRSQVDEILVFSLLPANVTWMAFSAIVTDSTLWEHLGYHIPKNKVFWDRRGKPRKPVPISDNAVNKSPAQVHGDRVKKTRAHKFTSHSEGFANVRASAPKASASKLMPEGC